MSAQNERTSDHWILELNSYMYTKTPKPKIKETFQINYQKYFWTLMTKKSALKLCLLDITGNYTQEISTMLLLIKDPNDDNTT